MAPLVTAVKMKDKLKFRTVNVSLLQILQKKKCLDESSIFFDD